MFIRKIRIGAHGKKTLYAICTEPKETGTPWPEELVRYESLELAVLALRFIKGVEMSSTDMETARKAIRGTELYHDRSRAG